MANSQTIVVERLGELMTHALELKKDGHWIFRGVQAHFYDIQPKIGRPESRKGEGEQDGKYVLQEEQTLLNYFVRRSTPYVTYQPGSTLEWLALAQHHGMFTRLLDWTESMLIAAYFAVEFGAKRKMRNPKTKVGEWLVPTIYAVKNLPIVSDQNTANQSLEQLNMGLSADVTLYYPPHISPRIPAQSSVFTVHKNPAVPFTYTDLRVFSITGSQLSWKHDLDACGINKASLFPDIDGLANHASWLYKWNELRG